MYERMRDGLIWGVGCQSRGHNAQCSICPQTTKPPIGITMAYRCGYTWEETVSLVEQWRRHSSYPKADIALLRLVSKLSGAYSGLACIYGTPPNSDGTASNARSSLQAKPWISKMPEK
jgi:hypothetical protein